MSLISALRKRAVERSPEPLLRSVRRLRARAIETWTGKAIWPRWAMLRTVEPLSGVWGNDRGLAVHRYYLNAFLERSKNDVRGRVLEFQDDQYATRLGGDAVTRLDILHVDDTNERATIVADLTTDNDIPSNTFDCIICTHVLHLIFDVERAVSELHRILKPGGTLLLAVPQTSMYAPYYHELWRFTPPGLKRVLATSFPVQDIRVEAYGNSLVTAGELRGLVVEEFSKKELDAIDERFALELCVRLVKRP